MTLRQGMVVGVFVLLALWAVWMLATAPPAVQTCVPQVETVLVHTDHATYTEEVTLCQR